MKPIIRWTIGPGSNRGLSCLQMSIKSFRGLYGDSFDYYIMYNGIPAPDFKLDFVNKINQAEHSNSLMYRPWDCCWKLYPPRINIDTAEIFMDNDFILVKKVKEFDLLIKHDMPFMSQGLGMHYGRYTSQVRPGMKLNCGFFGLPKGFDFAVTIKDICKKDIYKKWVDHYDDQGVIASTMCRFPKFNILPLRRIAIVGPAQKECPDAKEGYHFVYLNRKGVDHPGWRDYLQKTKRMVKML